MAIDWHKMMVMIFNHKLLAKMIAYSIHGSNESSPTTDALDFTKDPTFSRHSTMPLMEQSVFR